MKIYLVRHAHYIPDENSSDGSLSNQGKIQIGRLAVRLIRDGIEFEQAYSSPLLRARESALMCCRLLGIENLAFSDALAEERDDETRKDVSERMERFIYGAEIKNENKNILAFSHCFAIKHLLNSISPDPNRIVLPHSGIALLDHTGIELKIIDYAPNSHLRGIETY